VGTLNVTSNIIGCCLVGLLIAITIAAWIRDNLPPRKKRGKP